MLRTALSITALTLLILVFAGSTLLVISFTYLIVQGDGDVEAAIGSYVLVPSVLVAILSGVALRWLWRRVMPP